MSRSNEARRARLLKAAFHTGPIFRQGYDQHVRRWRKHVQRETWTEYHTDEAFAAAYEARIAEMRALPMPAMRMGDA